MGQLGEPLGAFAWTYLALPYLASAAVMCVLLVAVALSSGDRVIRIGLVSAAAALVPWSLATALALCVVEDRQLAQQLHQAGSGPTMFLGPAMFLVLLSVSGQLDRHRYLARVAIASGAVLMIVSWSTDWMISGVLRLRSGVWFPAAGPMVWLTSLQIVAWPSVGVLVAMRASSAARRSEIVRYLAALPVLAAVATADTLLAYGVGGSFPLAWVPALAGAGLCLHLMLRTDLLRGRGVDGGAARGLAARLGAAAVIALLVWLLAERSWPSVAVALATAPLWGLALVVSWLAPRSQKGSAGYEPALERFVRELAADDVEAAEARLARLWREHVGLGAVKLRLEVGALDEATRAWLSSLRGPVVAAEVTMMRLGVVREEIVRLLAGRRISVLVPVCDRGELLALAEAGEDSPRSLRDAERLFLFDSAQQVGHVLIYERLAREAKAAATAAREVEIANALAAHYRPLAEDDLGAWQLTVHHRPSARPGGEGWSWASLSPSRIAVMVAEADASGVAGALVVAALQGAFAAKSKQASCSAAELLDALGDTAPGSRRRALVLVLDAEAGEVTWASDGHYGAVVLPPSGEPVTLASAAHQSGSAALGAGSLVLLLSSGMAAAPGLSAALAAGRGRGLRLAAELLDLAATASSQGQVRERDLLAVGVALREPGVSPAAAPAT